MHERLILFAKRPRPGRVKTRLVPPLTPGQALELYRAFLADQICFLRAHRPGRRIELCVDLAWDPDPEFSALVADLPLTVQGPGDLGERMLRAFTRSHREGSTATVILGADTPTLPERCVTDAFRRLDQGAPSVAAPAQDGGYVLIGMGPPLAGLFRDVPWGSAEVLAVSRLRAREISTRLVLLDPWYDVDDFHGLQRLREELKGPGARQRAPRTARCLDRLDGVAAS